MPNSSGVKSFHSSIPCVVPIWASCKQYTVLDFVSEQAVCHNSLVQFGIAIVRMYDATTPSNGNSVYLMRMKGGAPLSLTKNARIFADLVLLAFRPTR